MPVSSRVEEIKIRYKEWLKLSEKESITLFLGNKVLNGQMRIRELQEGWAERRITIVVAVSETF